MKFLASLGYQPDPEETPRLFLVLESEAAAYEIRSGSGSWNHFSETKRRINKVAWQAAYLKANKAVGSLQAFAIIELDAYDLDVYASAKVQPNELAAFHQRWNRPGR